MTMANDAKFEGGMNLSIQNWHEEFDEFWSEYSKISKMYTLKGYFWSKYIMFELKKYRGVMLYGTEDYFKNDTRNLATFHRLKK